MKMSREEILINARRVRKEDSFDTYEFVVHKDDESDELFVSECVHVESLIEGIIVPIDNYQQHLKEVLFELNHVRVNPRIDNTLLLEQLTNTLQSIGVEVNNPPSQDSIAICFKPLGEIKDTVRFFMDKNGQLHFMTTDVHLRVIRNSALIAQERQNRHPFV